MSISRFMEHHYRHFNAAVVVDAAQGYTDLIDRGGKMFLAMAGAMSTAELGLSLAEMIRADKVHAISCTGANLEEDLFNLVAHDHYVRLPHYRDLSPTEERALLDRGLNPRHRHVHSRRRGHAPRRKRNGRGMDGSRSKGRATFSA